MAEQENLRLARESIEAWSAHDPNRLAKIVDEKFVAESDTLPAPELRQQGFHRLHLLRQHPQQTRGANQRLQSRPLIEDQQRTNQAQALYFREQRENHAAGRSRGASRARPRRCFLVREPKRSRGYPEGGLKRQRPIFELSAKSPLHSPSPRPSPSGRGRIFVRWSANPMRAQVSRA